MEPRRERLIVDGVPRRLARWASGEPTRQILALHGFTGSGVDWAPLAEQVAGEWVAPDLLGHGGCSYADPARYAFAAQAADVEALRAALGWERPLLVGYSFGARLALAALARDPSAYAGAVLIGGTAGIPDPVRRACRLADDRVRADVLRHVGAPAFLSSWARRPLLATQARIQSADRTRMAGARGLHSAEGLALSLRGAGTGSMPSLWEDLAQITTPTLLLCGAEDPKFCGLGRDLARALPAATCVTIPAAGHCAHLEAPQASAAAVGEFLSSLESR